MICGHWGAAYSSHEHEKIAVVLGHSEIVTAGPASIETYIDGTRADTGAGVDVVVLPSSGRDGVAHVIEHFVSHALFPEQPAAVAAAVIEYLRGGGVSAASHR